MLDKFVNVCKSGKQTMLSGSTLTHRMSVLLRSSSVGSMKVEERFSIFISYRHIPSLVMRILSITALWLFTLCMLPPHCWGKRSFNHYMRLAAALELIATRRLLVVSSSLETRLFPHNKQLVIRYTLCPGQSTVCWSVIMIDDHHAMTVAAGCD